MIPDKDKDEKDWTPEEKKRRAIDGTRKADSSDGLPLLQQLRSGKGPKDENYTKD